MANRNLMGLLKGVFTRGSKQGLTSRSVSVRRIANEKRPKHRFPFKEYANEVPSANRFSVTSYNILTPKHEASIGVPYEIVHWPRRRQMIDLELQQLDADFVALQELEKTDFEMFFTVNFRFRNFEGVYLPKGRIRDDRNGPSVDGASIFYRKSRFTLKAKEEVEYGRRIQEYMRDPIFYQRINSKFLFNFAKRDHVALFCLFEEKETNRLIVVVNTHLYWRPDHTAIKTVQAKMLIKSLQQFCENQSLNMETNPIIICGDFNSKPYSGVYNFIVTGELNEQDPDLMFSDNGTQKLAFERGLKHEFDLKSVYGHNVGEPWTTNHTKEFTGTLDYMFYTPQSLAVTKILQLPSEAEMQQIGTLPNVDFPSDHLPLFAEFAFKNNTKKTVNNK